MNYMAEPEISSEDLLRNAVSHFLTHHPFPWKIERDWAWEVLDANNNIVIKMPRHENAVAFIAYAEQLQLKIDQTVAEIMAEE